jgi:hypothetical protein
MKLLIVGSIINSLIIWSAFCTEERVLVMYLEEPGGLANDK